MDVGQHGFQKWSGVGGGPVRCLIARHTCSCRKYRFMKRIKWMGMVVAIGVASVQACYAQPGKQTNSSKASEKTTDSSQQLLPFVGKVLSVDASARTFTLNGKEKERLFRTTDHTEYWKDGKQVDFQAIAVGEMVRGNALKHETDWEVKKVTIGEKEKPEVEKKKK